MNATVLGQSISYGGFYDELSSFDIQPFGTGYVWFDIKALVEKTGHTVEEFERNVNNDNVKKQLYLDIEFWYNPVGSKTIVRNPRQPHFFHFGKKQMIADF